MNKPLPQKQQFANNLPREITFNRTCRHCSAVFQCNHADYNQWLNNELSLPWKRERVCSLACYKVVGDMPALSAQPVSVTYVPFHNPDVIVRNVVRNTPEISNGYMFPKPAIK